MIDPRLERVARAIDRRERIAKAMNDVAYAEHEEPWAKDRWPDFLPAADSVIDALRPEFDVVGAAVARQSIIRANERGSAAGEAMIASEYDLDAAVDRLIEEAIRKRLG